MCVFLLITYLDASNTVIGVLALISIKKYNSVNIPRLKIGEP